MEQRIAGFSQDADGQWIAHLECGHRQHMRHQPPWQNRPWVMSADGRAAKIGVAVDCRACDAPHRPPAGVVR